MLIMQDANLLQLTNQIRKRCPPVEGGAATDVPEGGTQVVLIPEGSTLQPWRTIQVRELVPSPLPRPPSGPCE